MGSGWLVRSVRLMGSVLRLGSLWLAWLLGSIWSIGALGCVAWAGSGGLVWLVGSFWS